jgi:hypothetical protein
MQLSASIFKAYDIRGVVPVTLDAEVAEALGRPSAAPPAPPAKRPWRWAATAACRAPRWPRR